MTGLQARTLAARRSCAMVACLVTMPWLVRNDHVLGAPVLNTNGGFNLYIGNNPTATGEFVSIHDTPRGATWEKLRTQGEIFASETLKHDAVDWMVDHPAQVARLAVKKFLLFWAPPLHDGEGPSSPLEKLIRMVWALQYMALFILALATLTQHASRNDRTTVLWLALVFYSAVHMLFYVMFRYREPIMPLLCILAAIGVERWITQRRTEGGARLINMTRWSRARAAE